ncbi:MAG: hypothetical protein IK127_02320 [Clostridia bacterium]|nr:hypothetical protein [Clostridia bacterium]
MKKILALALALCMIAGLVSAAAETYAPFNAGSITTAPKAAGGGEVDTVRYAGDETRDYRDEKEYTYHDYIAATTTMDWNPHTWETSDDSSVLDMMTMGFYGITLNADKSGYAITCEMAAELPVDVTAEYVGRFGVEEGETAKAWRIALNQDATWENGEKITADDYIYSMQQQLNPKMKNRRADSYYAGDLIIVNAKNYLYAGETAYSLVEDTAENLVAAGTDVYLDMNFWGIAGAPDADGNAAPTYVNINDETLYRDEAVEEGNDEDWVSAKYIFDNYLAEGAPYNAYQASYLYTAAIAPETAWEDVGLLKIDDYTIDLVLEKAMEEPAFYMPYHLSSNWLVYKPMYEELKVFTAADGTEVATEEEAASVTSKYMKDVETSISYGPYKITYFELDKQISYERNPEWYGYRDDKHYGMYQTDKVTVSVISQHETQMKSFEVGDLDGVALQSADMATYASSPYIYYTPQSYTTKVSFNTDLEKLREHGTGSEILTIKEFREAFALCIDREHFATAYTSAGTAGFGMLNYQYVYNPFTGEAYRDSEGAKNALVNLYGLTYGEGGEYADLDEAYDAMTGYDLELAREKMAVAAEKAVAEGVWDGESELTIDFRVYQNDTIYVQMFTYFDDQLKAACEGTPLEGKVSLTMTVDADYYNTMYSGAADVIFTTWGGAAMSPFTMLNQCYTDDAMGGGNQMEYGFHTEEVMMTINVDGKDVTDNLQNWTNWVGGATDAALVGKLEEQIGKFNDYDYATKCAFLAACEYCFLNYYTTTPVYYRNVAALHSQRVEFATYQYVMNVGFGGYAFNTYTMDDAEWADFIAAGNLQY